jgi:hypothetical protein
LADVDFTFEIGSFLLMQQIFGPAFFLRKSNQNENKNIPTQYSGETTKHNQLAMTLITVTTLILVMTLITDCLSLGIGSIL